MSVNERDLFPFIRDYCGDHCISEVSEVEALEEARENFGAAVDKHPEKFITVCQECFELLLEDLSRPAAPMKRKKREERIE